MNLIDISAETVTVAAIIGALAPLVIAVINQPRFTIQTRQIIAVIASVVIAVVALAVTGGFTDFSAERLGVTILLVVGTTQAAYALIWRPTDIAPKIEQATSSSSEWDRRAA